MEYKRFTDEERQKAKNTDMIAFLESYMGFEFKKVGKYYQCRQHDSLMIYPDRQGFSWNSRNISGSDAIDFLRNIEGKSFREAMEIILYGSFNAEIQPVIVKPPNSQIILPERAAQCNRLFDYLCKRRKISADVVNDFINEKMLYQDKKSNCVFVGFDENGTAKFASIRGTLPDRKYRADCKNSDKRYAFRQIGTDTTRIYIFEAPIDLMSHCTITDMIYGRGTYKQQTRLSLCGIADTALKAFLEIHKEVKILNFRLDNDETGHETVDKYTEKYQKLGYEVHAVFSREKDINEDLQKMGG